MKQVDRERLQEENTTRKDASPLSSNTSMMQKQRRVRPFSLLVVCWYMVYVLFQRIYRKRVSELRQMSQVECGLACLAMVLSYYGRKTSLSDIRMHYGVGRDGLSALDIVKAACSYGMRVRAISLQQNDFRFVTLPAIVHWDFNHFLVVERWSNLYFDQLNISLRYNYFSSTIATILTALSTAAPLALLWVGATQALNGAISLGTMVALDALAAAFFAPMASSH